MTGSSHLSSTMAAVCAAGGIAGYVKAKSVPSLLFGLGLGALYAGASYKISSGSNFSGHLLATSTSILLVGAMAPRFYRSRKVFPPGVLAVLGGVSAFYEGSKAWEWKDN